jgi:hypothetical protein
MNEQIRDTYNEITISKLGTVYTASYYKKMTGGIECETGEVVKLFDGFIDALMDGKKKLTIEQVGNSLVPLFKLNLEADETKTVKSND